MKQLFILPVIVLFSLLLLNATGAEAAESARITYLEGEVKVQRAGEDIWVTAEKGMVLKDSDRIKTLADSYTEIALDSTLKNIIRLEPETEIALEDLKSKRLFMSKGEVFSVLESLSPGSSFEVRTPTAVAGVAGSGMSVSTDGKTTDVSCFEDKAYVRGINVDGTLMLEVVVVEEGYKRVIGQFEMPSELIELTDFEIEQWSEFRQGLREHLEWLREKEAEGVGAAGGVMEQIEAIQEEYEILQEGKENIYETDEHENRDAAAPVSSSGAYRD